jgi:hypothetical protein
MQIGLDQTELPLLGKGGLQLRRVMEMHRPNSSLMKMGAYIAGTHSVALRVTLVIGQQQAACVFLAPIQM